MIVKARAVKTSPVPDSEAGPGALWGGWVWIGDVRRIQVLGFDESYGDGDLSGYFEHHQFLGYPTHAELNRVHENASVLFSYRRDGFEHVWIYHSDGRIELLALGVGTEAYLTQDNGDTIERLV